MKNLKFYSILGLSALLMLSACDKDEPNEDPNSGTEEVSPTITLSQTTLTIDAGGGVISVAYQVDNAVDGESISVDKDDDATWITVDEITDSNINFTVEANSEIEERTASFTVSYSGAEDVSLTVIQEAVVVQFDYEYTLTEFKGFFYGEDGSNGEDMFYIWLSDLEFDGSGYTQEGGHYYNFALYVNESNEMTLPTGTYAYTSGTSGDMVFSGYYSRYIAQYSNGYELAYFTDGSITVSEDGGVYTIEGVVTDEDGAVHSISYTGSPVVKNGNFEDLEFTATTALGYYWERISDQMNVLLFFTDMEISGDEMIPPGAYMYVDTYVPYNIDGKITPGTYIVDESEEIYTVYPYFYSYVFNYDAEGDYTYDTIESGTMTITAGSEEDHFTIVCDFVTEGGFTVKCTYTGYLVVDDMPGPYSTLTENITPDISNTPATAYSWGDYYETGGKNWYIEIYPESGGGDALWLDLNTEWRDASEGVPSGTYTASSVTTPKIGEFAYGYLWYEYSISGTWYVEVDEVDDILNMSPAISGDITVTNYGDGSYKIEFACTDDAGYTWSGTWEGEMPIDTEWEEYWPLTSSSTSKSSKVSNFKMQKMPTTGMKKAKTKDAQIDKIKVPVSAKESRTDAVKILKVKK